MQPTEGLAEVAQDLHPLIPRAVLQEIRERIPVTRIGQHHDPLVDVIGQDDRPGTDLLGQRGGELVGDNLPHQRGIIEQIPGGGNVLEHHRPLLEERGVGDTCTQHRRGP